jgi:hypothetical protein
MDEFEEYEEYEDDIETEVICFNPISGTNILTGCYGLFLIADEQTSTYEEDAHLMKAFQALEDLEDYPFAVGMAMFKNYPPEDLSYSSIMYLATCVIKLRDLLEEDDDDE